MTKFLAMAVVLAASTAHADKTFNDGDGGAWDCATEAEVTINTSGATYALAGACTDVTVNGTGNTVTIEKTDDITVNGTKQSVKIGAVNAITVNGTSNAVVYKAGIAKAKASVKTNGTKNTVKQDAKLAIGAPTAAPAAPAAPAADLLVGEQTTLDCATNKAPTVTGTGGVFYVAGACDKVSVTGSGNHVAVDSTKGVAVTGSRNTVTVKKVDKVAITGAGNTVTWTAGLSLKAPKVAKTGTGNTVAKVK